MKLEEIIYMAKYQTATEKLEAQVDTGRRGFLKKMLGLGIGSAIGGTGFLKSEEILAESLNILPPGFQICPDDKLVQVYLIMLQNNPNYDSEMVKKRLTMKTGLASQNVMENTPLTEPAYWFTVNHYNYKYQNQGTYGMIDKVEFLAPKFNVIPNSPMYNWAKGINMYFRTWVDKESQRYGSTIETETYLLRAIFTASGKSESEVEDYKKLDLQLKERKLQEMMSNLEKQNHTNQLIAAWSSFMYGNHEARKLNNKGVTDEGKLMNAIIEIPLRKYIPKIRGPPYYPGI